MTAARSITIVLFDGFELLDVFGPAELFSQVDGLTTSYVGPTRAPVASAQGVAVVPDFAYADAPAPDIVLVPGGRGTRTLVNDPDTLAWLRAWAGGAQLITSVCTGSGLLAAAGLLDGYRATSNKRSFAWASSQGADVEWVPEARWVEDRDRWTSSGVAAGMDMAAALIASIFGADAGQRAADLVELELHTDPHWDPFAKLNGLVD
ncbi:DJ-1/PfpI family protein [Gryllotalpicola protaetiae]|uniref:DJ-1/PfpI family protein n=1 Tax=Gryllotalpicola protaetiae TaxID=2419771 RepID=A0A387BIR1_9MICO|nr:DJ-1/PfpI family protein [Gryllotalpicola protaetiae]AYG02578.1 DJ-1/PfpI family protein [Gryllotalpicola protaetiae]